MTTKLTKKSFSQPCFRKKGTLRDYVACFGGELELVCTFKGGKAVRIRTGRLVAAAAGRGNRGVAKAAL